ncbi:MAG: 1-acyl-sn-glycerol-3-phosphate acyltransferase [Deltaproteobacteria bacterium]|nr:1-acyl-sn-glycerol-3-phosphate acyltransferase [Deltaproteobacteria bacterium]
MSFEVRESRWTRWGRRALSVPAVYLGLAITTLGLPLWLALAAIADVASGGPRRRWPLVRSVVLLWGYFFWVCFGVTSWAVAELISFGTPRPRYLRRLFRLQQIWARGLFNMARRTLSLRVHVEEGFVPDEQPILLFVRHASLVDVLLPAVFVSGPHDVLLRYVMKREVLFDPAIDIVGQRLENAFVSRGKGSAEREEQAIRSLASGLGAREGVIVFPEGTRFSEDKQREAIGRVRASGDAERLARVEGLRHVLPPRSRGPLAVLDTAQRADVIFLAHRGFDGAHGALDLLRGTLIGRAIELKTWRVPRAEVPAEREACLAWLDREWARVDAWIESRVAAETA